MPHVIHFVDISRIDDELRPVCGAWSELVTWTTVPRVVTCLACAQRLQAGGACATPRRA